jgi:hypothetical protein
MSEKYFVEYGSAFAWNVTIAAATGPTGVFRVG